MIVYEKLIVTPTKGYDKVSRALLTVVNEIEKLEEPNEGKLGNYNDQFVVEVTVKKVS
jgi:hypothetical protein